MADEMNLLGATVFWLYIVAALTFTAIAINAVVNLPASQSRHISTFAVLALISFSILSFNMLHVLVQSYVLWEKKRTKLPLSLGSIWQWSITSTLFRDFGEAIVEDPARYLYIQSALLQTLAVCFYMGSEGVRHRVPHLWVFFALSQILPISFAQNLFCIALLRSPPQQRAIGLPQNTTIRIIAAYCACLLVAPCTRKTQYLIPIILLARLMLFLPFLISKESNASARKFGHGEAQAVLLAFSVALVVKQAYFIAFDGTALYDVGRAVFDHPAVTALGLDFFISITSLFIWQYVNERDSTESKMKKAAS